MRVLVIGAGAREHALCWKLGQESGVDALFCAPGNAGIAREVPCLPLDVNRPAEVVALAAREAIDLTVVGPEAPLTAGVVDAMTAAGHRACGPTQRAAAIESSKAFAKRLMASHGVPTARHLTCSSPAEALGVLRAGAFGLPVVIKADGLAAGKGVVVAEDAAAAEAAVRDMMVDRRFGDAGSQVVVEEFLSGREASFFVVTDGVHARVLPTAEDHKRAFDGDKGPNTGGMGAFSPSPLVTDSLAERVLESIVFPTLRGLAAEGRPYRGFLYCGLMITADGPNVIEFNARMGDPETQVVLPGLAEDLLPHLWNAAGGRVESGTFRTRGDRHVGVVLASGGYPDRFETGRVITGLDAAAARSGTLVFHAGTAAGDGGIVTSGGRVLTVVGGGPDFAKARERAYDAVATIGFDGMHYRSDIGVRAVDSSSQ
ncbi:MAG: phosphoribosylamine--glycine ligase [Vicinamibacterales bacterium]|jgi:phosphoribosylamine--glycine ligase|nr:phosphoribosylamine--glycine ligase [Vicinamibacterales bacterium]